MGWFSRKKKTKTEAEMHMEKPVAGVKMAKDPVCGMEVNIDKPAATSAYQGQTFYFCSLACKKAFDEKPNKYIKGTGHEVAGHGGHCM